MFYYDYPIYNILYVTHLLKTSRKSHFWLFKYDVPFESESNPLYNDTKIILLSQT